MVHIAEDLLRVCAIPRDNAYFDFDSSKLTSGDQPVLDRLAGCFTSGPMKDGSLKLIGHADPRGEMEYNFVLGHSRAAAVAHYLQSRNVTAGRLLVTSRGELDSVGTDEDGWARDRRVDVSTN